jgi:hypothetical protein
VKGLVAESPRFPAQRSSAQGESAPKVRARAVADGNPVNIPEPPTGMRCGDGEGYASRLLDVPVKRVGGSLREIREVVTTEARDHESFALGSRGYPASRKSH